jgi:biotin carboxyl carrier protein
MDHFKKVGTTLWVHKDGRTFSVDLNSQKRVGQSLESEALSGVMKSPMPGKVLKILVNSGDLVRVGQTLSVIEAMKMEYALKAPFAGAVKEVSKKVGDVVRFDETILVLEKGK